VFVVRAIGPWPCFPLFGRLLCSGCPCISLHRDSACAYLADEEIPDKKGSRISTVAASIAFQFVRRPWARLR
jgi:hypothetical protein